MRNRISLSLLAAGGALLTVATPALAEERWASPTADPTTTTCLSTSPCSLTTAVEGAQASSEIIVMPGTYAVSGDLKLAQPIAMHGQPGQPRPVLEGPAIAGAQTFKVIGAATVSHLEFRATAPGGLALKLKEGAGADRVVARAADGIAIDVDAAANFVGITNSLAVSGGANAIVIGGLNGAAPIELRNVTAQATGAGSVGVVCGAKGPSSGRIVNSIIRGADLDVDATSDATACSADHSNIRTSEGRSPGLAVSANSESDPGLDADHRPVAGSPLVDAGIDDAANGTLDLDGAQRRLGAATDIGAFETAGTTTGGGTVTTTDGGGAGTGTGTTPGGGDDDDAGGLPAVTPPKLGVSMIVKVRDGVILVHIPGTGGGFVALEDAASVPPGAIIDATKGAVVLRSALKHGKQQTATFRGGKFRVRQSPKGSGMVDVDLVGGSFARCGKASGLRASASAKRKRRYVRRLWVSDKGGKYRTHGRNSVATVRGTRWLTEDRCSGTFTKVTKGAVDVKDKRRGTVRRVRAGQSVLVRPRRR